MEVSTAQVLLGPLEIEGGHAVLSGLRWLRDDGDFCRAGEPFAYCNIAIPEHGKAWKGVRPFDQERRDLQVAFASPVAGRLRMAGVSRLGGFADFMTFLRWQPDLPFASIELEGSDGQPPAAAVQAQVTMFAGQRTTDLAEVRTGLLTGWHSRSRAAHVADSGVPGTLLSMGICELEPVVKGPSHAFVEMLAAAPGPAHVMFVPDQALVPCARILAEQATRSPAENERVAGSFRGLFGPEGIPDSESLMGMGAILRCLMANPLDSPADVVTRAGLRRIMRPDAILMSVHSECAVTLEHRQLGYTLAFHGYRLGQAGPALQRWLRDEFVRVPRRPGDIERDYEALVDVLAQRAPGVHLLVSNMVSSRGREDVASYSHLPQPLEDHVESVRAKDLNLMLASLARRKGIAVVDVDAIAAEIGLADHSFDGVHHDGAMSDAIRAEILSILTARRVPGFFPAS